MATKEEWKEYFVLMNGHEPSLTDFQSAMANGEITNGSLADQVQAPQEAMIPMASTVKVVIGTQKRDDGVTNYYDELGISKSFNLEQIQTFLKEKHEETARRWESTPQNYAKYLMECVGEATEIFASDENRAKYDEQLAQSENEAPAQTVENPHVAKYNKWISEARRYYFDKEYDTAAEALNKVFEARSALEDESETDSLELASYVYNDAHEYKQALRYTNQALILHPEYPWLYKAKYIAMYNMNFASDKDSKDKITLNTRGNDLDKLLEKYTSTAQSYGDADLLIKAEDYAAGQYFWELSGFIGRSDNLLYSDNLTVGEIPKIGRELANKYLEEPNSSLVLKGYQLALEKKKAYTDKQSAKNEYDRAVINLKNFTPFKYNGTLLGILGLVGIGGLALPANAAKFVGILALIGLAVYIYMGYSQNSNKTTLQNAVNSAKTDLENKTSIYDNSWTKGLLPIYNEWKKLN